MHVKDINKINIQGDVSFRRLLALTIKNLKNDIRFLNRMYSKIADDNIRRVISTKSKQLKIARIMYEPWCYYAYRNWLKLNHSHEPSIDKMTSQEYILDYCLSNDYILNQNIYNSVSSDIGYLNKKDHVAEIFISLYKEYKR